MANYLLGVQQSGLQLKIAAFIWTHGKYKLHSLTSLPTNFDENKISEALQLWVSNNLPHAENISAFIAIPESNIFLKVLELPKTINESQIGEAAKWEVLIDPPIPVETAIYDWKKLKQSGLSIEVLTFLIKAQIPEAFVSIFERAGIEVLAIEPTSYAFMRTAKEDFSKNSLLITIEGGDINLIVINNCAPVFTTSFKLYTQQATEVGIKLTSDILKVIYSEIKKIIDFWEEKSQLKIEQVIFPDYFSDRFMEIVNEIAKFTQVPILLSKTKHISKFSIEGFSKIELYNYDTAIGAATRIFSKEKLNFLPKTRRDNLIYEEKVANRTKNIFTFLLINIGFIVVNIVIFLLLSFRSSSLQTDINQTQMSIATHSAQSQLKTVEIINQKSDMIYSLIKAQKNSGQRLRLIASLTPTTIKLTNVDLNNSDNEIWKLKGTGTRTTVLAYYEKLLAEANAKSVSMPYSNFSQESGNFEINIIW